MPPAARSQTPAPAPAAALVTSDTNISGVVAEVTEVKRKEGVLTVKVRFRNTSPEKVHFYMISGRNFDEQYVTAGSKKYFILRDSEKTPLAPQADGGGNLDATIAPGGTWTWWAKYPAPPPEVKAISYYTSVAAPIEDLPITDM
jgi:hypothetical protein